MATHLDLQEQEQLDELKAFWKQHGNLITWTLTLVLLAYAGWAGWGYWQREQATKAAAMYDELDRAATAGDAARADKVFADLKERYPRTIYAQQAGMLAAKLLYEKGKPDAAAAALSWVADKAVEREYQQLARLRLAGVQLDAKKYDDALKLVAAVDLPALAGLAADRRGDILQAQGKRDDARSAYQQAYAGLEEGNEYRRLVEAKLTALGGAVAAAASAASGAAR